MDYKLQKLQVVNFRNIQPEVIQFVENINCIFGDNGNGKTNILEAIYFLLNRKSFRKNTSFSQMISIEAEKPSITFSSLFINENEQLTFSGKLFLDSSEWHLNNQATKKKIGIECVFINPFDSYAFHNVPAFRREWIDSHISKLNKKYKTILNKYNQSLRFRNTLLSKKPDSYLEQIHVIDLQLSDYAYFLLGERKKFLGELKEYCRKTFKNIFDESHDLEIKIETKFDNMSVEDILNFYKESLEKDIIIGKTRYGIHRDDYVFHFDGFNSYEYCSLGQQKMSFLSLIFAYIELFRYKFNSYPLVLIDDVSGELDGQRWENLIDYLKSKSFQVFITTANKNFKEALEKIESAHKIYINDGVIEQT